MLVLAGDVDGSVGVDLDSGAFVRAAHPGSGATFSPFDVVTAEIAGSMEPPDAARPEAVELGGAPRRVGRLSPRRAEKLLAPLRHPPQLPLLGITPSAVPYWTLTGDRPSLALVDLRQAPRLRWNGQGLDCRFRWQRADHVLPVVDPVLVERFAEAGVGHPSRGTPRRGVERLLGYRPRRLLVVLTPPVDGYCHKGVAALLPVK